MLIRWVRGAMLIVVGVVTSAGAFAGEPEPQERAAREYYRLVIGDHFMQNYLEAMMPAIRSNPQLAPYEDVVREWFTKAMANSHLEDQMVSMFAEMFSEQELKELTAFYQTPVGRKALAKMPEAMRRGGELGAQWARENGSLLDAMIAKRKEDEAKAAAKP